MVGGLMEDDDMMAADLIRQVQECGGTATLEGDNLKLIAARPLPTDLLHDLRTHKSELVAYLAAESPAMVADESADPAGPCPTCGSGQFWQAKDGGPWRCRVCRSDMPLTATTLTLPCHKVKARPARADAQLRTLLEAACQGLTITPEQLWHELKAGRDLPDLESGALTPHGLRLTAETLAVMRYSGDVDKQT